MTKLYAWDFPTLDLATLRGAIVLHATNDLKCTVTRADSERVDLACDPLGAMALVRIGGRLRVVDCMCNGSDVVRAISVEVTP